MFVAINYISCQENYQERFEELFATRARAIDLMPGFKHMEVLKPTDRKGDYLIISRWESEMDFRAWTGSDAFLAGHKRGFRDVEEAKHAGMEPPMKSTFRTYTLIAE
jgi:heme oxygenase (mycobilin-producing)